jgi:uncharacterized protein YukE
MPHAWPPPGPISRPAGEPGALAAGARRLGAAAEALRDAGRRLRGTTSFAGDAGAWRGPASEAFLVDAGGFQSGLGRAADALGQAAGALAELAARLGHAQASWDRARRLAAVAGVDLGPPGGGSPHEPGPRPGSSRGAPGPAGAGLAQPPGDPGGVRSPATAVDPLASVVAGQALRMAEAAELEAAAARRTAAARLEAAGHLLARARTTPGGSGRLGGPSASTGRGGAGNGGAGDGGQDAAAPTPGGSQGEEGGEGRGGLVERAVGRALEAGAEVATATHHLVTAAEARIEAAGRLAATADDPAVRAAAGRVVETAGRPLVDGTVLGALPLAAPILELGAALHDGEPLPRALAGALGSAVGADLGGRAGLAACGGEAAVTEGVGLIVCPTLTAVGGALGAQAGRTAALHVYDELTGAEPARPPDRGPVRPGREPGG